MLSSLYIHKITAIRYANTGQDTLGTFTSSSSSVGTGAYIPCRRESYSEKMQYNEGGNRKVNSTIYYIPPEYTLMLKDEIYDYDTGECQGIIIGINPAMKAFSTDLDHNEIILENK